MRAHSLADGFRRRCALRHPQSAPHPRTYRVRGDHARARNRHDLGDIQHGRCADLPALPRAASERRRHSGEHYTRQQLRLVSPIANTWTFAPKPRATMALSPTRIWKRSASAPNPQPRRGSRAECWFPATTSRCSAWSRGWGAGFREDEDQVPGRNRRGGARTGLLEARIRERPFHSGQHGSPERHGVHRDWRRAGKLPGNASLRASRLLHAARHGARVFHQPPEEFLRGPRRSRIEVSRRA